MLNIGRPIQTGIPGIAPPPIRVYRQEEGHNTIKIMRVPNAFHQHKTEIR